MPRVHSRWFDLLHAAYDLVTQCACIGDQGYPSCLHLSSCNDYNEHLSKGMAICILSCLLDRPIPLAVIAKRDSCGNGDTEGIHEISRSGPSVTVKESASPPSPNAKRKGQERDVESKRNRRKRVVDDSLV